MQQENAQAEVTLVKGAGGAFELRVDDVLVFSKLNLGRYPEEDEIRGFAH